VSNPDRPTPPEPHRAARVPRPSPRASADDPQAVRDAESLERRLREEQRRKRPPVVDPTPIRDRPEPDRSRTPESGGIEAQRPRPHVEIETIESIPPRSRAPSRGDWSKLAYKLATAAVAALVLVIAALGYLAVAAINAKAEAYKAEQRAKEDAAKQKLDRERAWRASVITIAECRHRAQAVLNARQFPESQRPASGGWPIWKDECGDLPLPPPP
jgi:hypothetical protein